MYRSTQNITHTNFLFDDLGFGDAIAALPALLYIYKYHPHIIMHIWGPDFMVDLIKRSLPTDKNRVIVRSLAEGERKFKQHIRSRTFKIFHDLALATHPTTVGFLTFLTRDVSIEHKNYLAFDSSDQDVEKFSLPEKYVVVTTNYTTPVREWRPEHVNNVCKYIRAKGYTPVFMGKEATYNGFNYTIKGNFNDLVDLSNGISLLDRTTLLEGREVIRRASCIVGLDNGLIHLAATTETPIVVGYTTVEPEVRMPFRKNIMGWGCYPVVPPPSLSCRFCQSQWSLTYGHDFRNCFYGDNKCTYELNAPLYIEQLEKVL